MSLEECKSLADPLTGPWVWKRMERSRARHHAAQAIRHSVGRVGDKRVTIYLSRGDFLQNFLLRIRWVVSVWACGVGSDGYFGCKDIAEKYFEELTQKYGLKEGK